LARFEVESLAALSREDWSLALKMAQEGRALATKLGVVLQQGRLAGLAGEAALALGDAVSAAGHFKALQEIAVALDVPLLLAQALFGVAASVPYADSAAGAASEAYRVLGVATTGLMEADSEMFWRLPANARIRQGSYYAFGLPRSRPRGTQPLKPETGVFREMW
jgi:hypothetical protein